MRQGLLWLPVAILAVATLAPPEVAADHDEPEAPHKWVRAELVTGFQPCLEADANACVGPIEHPDAVAPVADCNVLTVAECAMKDECRLACSPPALNDPVCTFKANGAGSIRARQHGSDLDLVAKAGGLSDSCEGQQLCIKGNEIVSTHECSYYFASGCDKMNCPCTVGMDIMIGDLNPDVGCGIVRKGRINIKTSVNAVYGPLTARNPLRPGQDSGFELWDGGLQRNPEFPEVVAGSAFVAGLMLPGGRDATPPPPSLVPLPKNAKRAEGSLVTGYQACEPGDGRAQVIPDRFSRYGCTPTRRNDNLCGFTGSGSGEASAKIIKNDVEIGVEADGISCEGEVLCLSASQRVVTSRCQAGSCPCTNGCSIVERVDEIVGRGDWGGLHSQLPGPTGTGTGCCQVTNGTCSIHTKANWLSPNLIRDGDVSVGAFFRTGLYRVNKTDGMPLAETEVPGPAFLIGLLVE